MTAPTLIPSAGTGLAGSWHVSSLCGVAVRSDAPIVPPLGPNGCPVPWGAQIVWNDEMRPEMWRELAALLWDVDGRIRAGSVVGRWARVGHVAVANGPGLPVVLSAWALPVVTMDGAHCSAVEVDGRQYVRVRRGGDVVAVVMARRVEVS